MTEQEEIVRKYLRVVEVFDDITPFVSGNAVFVEHPNAINRNGQTRNLEQALKGLSVGRSILAWQKNLLLSIVESGSIIFAEVEWTGQMAIDAGHMKKNQLFKAHCAFRFEFSAGKIMRQISYDCYEPF